MKATDAFNSHAVTSLEALEALYGSANKNSLAKETKRLTPDYRRWIEAAPFFAIASAGPGGLDCSPRGDARGSSSASWTSGPLPFPIGAATTGSTP